MTKDLQTLAWLTSLSIPAEIQDFWIRRYGADSLKCFKYSDLVCDYTCVLLGRFVSEGWYPQTTLARFSDCGDRYYLINKQKFEEADMLKVIRLPAFL